MLAEGKVRGALQPAKRDPAQWTATAAVRQRLIRARQLEAAALPDWAEFELRFAAAEQPYIAAAEIAEMASVRGEYDKALRTVKSIARDYLSLALPAAPESFWKLAFPMPWRSELEFASRANGVDPFLLAALIRQESEFNPRAVSRARAYGLTQVLPSTGRAISRRAGVHGFTSDMLFRPDVSLRIGAYHLRSMLDAHGGQEHLTLASYNAGKTRTDLWLTWYDYREAAEFVETIPFTETRTYVQAVLRNAAVYRKLYANRGGTRRGFVSYGMSGD